MKKKLTTRSAARAARQRGPEATNHRGHHHRDEIEQHNVGQAQRPANRDQRDRDEHQRLPDCPTAADPPRCARRTPPLNSRMSSRSCPVFADPVKPAVPMLRRERFPLLLQMARSAPAGPELPRHAGDQHAALEEQPGLEPKGALVVEQLLPGAANHVLRDVDDDQSRVDWRNAAGQRSEGPGR